MLTIGTRIEIAEPVKVNHDELKYEVVNGARVELHAGRFIVDDIDGDMVILADADWTDDGHATFQSTKWRHRVPRKVAERLPRCRS